MGYKHRKRNQYTKGRLNRHVACRRLVCSGLSFLGTVTFILLLSTAFIFGYDVLTQHPYFRLKHVHVDGTYRLSNQEVVQQSGIHAGDNILSINLKTVQKRLLSHPLIAEASVQRVLPSRIELIIKEHIPLAILDLGRKFTINTQGIIYEEADPLNPERLPLINGLEYADIRMPGQPDSPAFKAVMEVLKLGQSLKSIIPNRVVQEIHVDRDMGLTLSMGHYIKVIKLGYDNYPIKYKQLEHILYYLKTKPEFSCLDEIDLNNVNRIVVHPSANKLPVDLDKEV